MRERCAAHNLVVGDDGRCVLCRRSQPAPATTGTSRSGALRLLLWTALLGCATAALLYVRYGDENDGQDTAVTEVPLSAGASVTPPAHSPVAAATPTADGTPTSAAAPLAAALPPTVAKNHVDRVADATDTTVPALDAPVRAVVKLVERHPLSAPRVQEGRGGDDDGTSYVAGGETFSLFVPQRFVPDGSWGVLVWIAASNDGRVPRADWEAVLARHRLIWIGGNRAGNHREVSDRIGIALDALHAVQTRMRLDERRVIIGGMSGGAKTALRTQLLYPDLIAGALPVCGADFYRALPARQGHYPARGHEPKHLEAARRRPVVMVTGTADFNLDHVSKVADAMRADGYGRVQVDVIEGLGHRVPDAGGFERALASLLRHVDGR